MISVILYGRNDAHGYNLHRRAALSLNCLAQVLTGPDDEIVFVDYNTPDELPTFVEALADTLTDRCIDLLRVHRVPATLHRERYASRTPLPALEPIARNAAVRRANPANRWLLSTNTDMILLPKRKPSLSDVCADLGDGFYGLPRFELPEWLWERLPRSMPAQAMAEVARLGPRLRLDEVTLNDEWVRFDAPGDFQLFLRDDFVAIGGFDEGMLLGWHVDSNFGRRLVIRRGSEDNLADHVAAYHCNHSRIPTVYGSTPEGNDLTRFYTSLDRADLPRQRDGWGLPDVVLEEVPVRRRTGQGFADALASAIPESDAPRYESRVANSAFVMTYDSGHVLPFVADSVAVSPPGTTIGYLGANHVLKDMLERLVAGQPEPDSYGFEATSNWSEVDALLLCDVVVVDFGLDASVERSSGLGEGHYQPSHLPEGLRAVIKAFAELVERERERLLSGEHPRRFVLVNSTAAYVNPFVVANLECSHTSTHSRVRRAMVRRVPTARLRATRDLAWGDRLDHPRRPLTVEVGRALEIDELESFDGFGEGWHFPDTAAIWTQGERAELLLTLGDAASPKSIVIELSFVRVGVLREHTLHAHLVVDGTRVATRSFAGGTRRVVLRGTIAPDVAAKGAFEVALEIDSGAAWTDERKLGLHLRSITLRHGGVRAGVAELAGVGGKALARARNRLRATTSSAEADAHRR